MGYISSLGLSLVLCGLFFSELFFLKIDNINFFNKLIMVLFPCHELESYKNINYR